MKRKSLMNFETIFAGTMIKLTGNLGTKNWFAPIIAIILITDIAIVLNIPFLRQIIGFLFLTILPGLLILLILKLNNLEFTEKIVLSVGLSVSFLIFFGFLIDKLYFSLGYATPLSTISLVVSFSAAMILVCVIGCRTNKEAFSFALPNFNLNTAEKAFLIVPVLFPALSIFGMHVMNTTDNNTILMFLLFLIPIYVAFVCFFNHKFPKRLYPVVIFLISISLLLLLSLRSNHIIGMDTHVEYYFFRTTLDNFHWSIAGHSTLDACLAISLLPTIYQSILNISPEYLFKILYSLIYSISPLVIYVLSKKYVGEQYAFLASCFFMFQQKFLCTESNARVSIAILFFALAMMTFFNDKINPLKKRILFIIFMASCMVSHYSTMYIFFFIMLGTFIGIEILSKKYTFKKVISLTLVILFFSMIFFWYSQVTEAAFNSGVVFIENTLSNLNKFFIVESRGSGQALLGKDIMQKGIPHRIEFMFTWLTIALIGVGLVTLIRRYKEMSFPELGFQRVDFLKEKFKVGYFLFALACAGMLVMILAVPYIADAYSFGRAYPLAITILSVFFVIGGIILWKYLNGAFAVLRVRGKALMEHFLSKERTCAKKETLFALQKIFTEKCYRSSFDKPFLSKKRFGKNTSQGRAYLIILLVLIPYSLCATGVMYNIFGVPREIALNSEGKEYDWLYVHDQESYSAKWLGILDVEQNNPKIYTDRYGGVGLISQGKIWTSIDFWSLAAHEKIDGYIYLDYYNVVDEKLTDLSYITHNMAEYSDVFVGMGKIYDNGGSEIWK